MYLKKGLILSMSVVVFWADTIYSVEIKDNNVYTENKLGVDLGGINWAENFKKLPNDIKKEILNKIFKNFDINNLDELINIKRLREVNKDFNEFIKNNYAKELKEISDKLGQELVKISSMTYWFNRHLDMAKKIIQAGTDINFKDINGLTPLMHACMVGNEKLIKLLLEFKANPDLQDNSGDTALIIASIPNFKQNFKEIMELLINAKANLNIQNNDGYTALMTASEYAFNKDIVQLLIDANADVNLKNNLGKTAWDLATTPEAKDILQKAIDKLK